MRVLAALLAVLALAGCGGSADKTQRKQLLIVVDAPFSKTPYLGRKIENGARLAAGEINAGGIKIGETQYELAIRTMDNALSPARAVANTRRASSSSM